MLDAAIAARNQLGLGTATDLSEIADLRVAAAVATIAEQFNGAPHKRRPTQIVEAQFALPYLIATGVVHGRVGITEVADIHNAEVLNIAERIAGVDAEGGPVGVTIRLRDGRAATVSNRSASRLAREPPRQSSNSRPSLRTVRATRCDRCRTMSCRGGGHDPAPGRSAGCQRTAAALRLIGGGDPGDDGTQDAPGHVDPRLRLPPGSLAPSGCTGRRHAACRALCA